MLYTKEGLLFAVQVDHVNGEVLGSVIDSFYEAGAKNVQVVSAVTKKNRPSYMIFVDGRSKDAEAIERVIVQDLASSGWHRIATEHRHTDVSIETREIRVVTEKETFTFPVQGKVINDDVQNARPEYDCCTELKMLLTQKAGLHVPLRRVTQQVETVFLEDKKEIIFKEDQEYAI